MTIEECRIPIGNPTSREVAELLQQSKRIAVVGLSDKPHRDSFRVAQYLIRHGYDVVPVNPMVAEVLGRKSYGDLSQVPGSIDIVNVFRKSEAVEPIVEEAIRMKTRGIWMQLGVVHEKAAQRAREAGMVVIQSRCILVDHARFLGD